MKKLFDTIISDIKSDKYFLEYKFRKKSNNMFLQNKRKEKSLILGLDHWRNYVNNSCSLYMYYGIRFEILTRWFEKYCVLSIPNQRFYPHFGLSNLAFGKDECIEFKYDFSDYDKKIETILLMAKKGMDYVAQKYATLEDCYNVKIVPLLNDKEKFPDTGACWLFMYLTLVYLVDKKVYPYFKKRILAHADWMQSRNEPNIEYYYDRMDEIILYMENSFL